MTPSDGSTTRLALLVAPSQQRAVERICVEGGLRPESHRDLEALLASAPDCAILDRALIDSSGAALERLREAGVGAVLLLCELLRPWELRALLEAGASGVVLEQELDEALRPCLQAAMAGQVCVPREYASRVEPPTLSAREKQVLGLVVMGHTNGEIANRLFLAESTVKSHLSSAFGKLGVRSRNEAVELILDPDRGLGLGILGLTVEQVA